MFQAATITRKKKIIMTQTTTFDPGNNQMQIHPLSIHTEVLRPRTQCQDESAYAD